MFQTKEFFDLEAAVFAYRAARTHTAPVDPRIVELAKWLPSAEAMEFFAVDQREFYNRLSADEARALADAAALIREMAGEKAG